MQKYPGLRRQRPLSFNHAQRNALREGKGRALQRRVPIGGGSVLKHRLKEGNWFGFAEVDIEIPEPLRPKFEEMCPIFFNKEVRIEVVPKNMLDYVRRTGRKRGDGKKLVGALSAERLLVYNSLLLWYVDHGAVITKVYRTIAYQPAKIFPWFVEQVTEARGHETWKKARRCLLRCSSCWGTAGTGSSSKPWSGKQTSFT